MVSLPSYKGKTVAVLGLGVAGISSAKALVQSGAKILAWDDNKSSRNKASAEEINLYDLSTADFSKIDCMLISPGIGKDHPIAKLSIDNNCPLIGEVKLLWESQPDATFIGITGTNGKSTTTALIEHILKQAGFKYASGGNTGVPAISLPDLGKDGIYILEMSSYMLERIDGMKFDIGVFLNLTPDHLSRHHTMEEYFFAKSHLFDNMTSNDTAVICTDDNWGKKIASITTNTNQKLISYKDIREEYFHLPDNHNRQNIAVAMAVAETLNIPIKSVKKSLFSFPGLQHRQQIVSSIGKIAFVNDSKATNAEATQKALSSYNNIYWIAGGEEKGDGYDVLINDLNKVNHAYLIGEGAKNISKFLNKYNVPFTISKSLENATTTAFNDARKLNDDSIVLLSPACASWDQFDSFEHRGNVFENITKKIEVSNG